MPTLVRRVARAGLVAALLVVGMAVPAASAGALSAPSQTRPVENAVSLTSSVATAGAGWIAGDLSPSGALVDATSKKASVPDTSNAVLALVAAGDGANQVKAAINWLKQNYGSYVSSHGLDDPGALALVTLAATAGGANPRQFGGRAKVNDLVSRLEATEQTSGATAGAFGSGPSVNAFSQALALLALAALKNLGSRTRLGVRYLESLQCTDGGWEYNRVTTTAPCAAPSPKNCQS